MLRAHEMRVLEEERQRLARDLHDEAGHRLTAAILKLDAVVQRYGDHTELRENLEAARRLLTECAAGLHEVAFNLRPSILSDLGLVPAIRSLARRAEEATGIKTTVEFRGLSHRLPENIELTAFRIAQEALTNALKYSWASTITIRAVVSDQAVTIEVSDDGVGFDNVQHPTDRPRLGLKGIQERVELAGGQMWLQTGVDRGTTVWARLPWGEVAS